MNLKQKIALGMGVANLAVMWLFPPFDAFSFTDTKIPIFAGFHFRFAQGVHEVVNGDMLFLEIVVLLANVGIFWLLLRDKDTIRSKGRVNYQNAILLLVAANLTMILLFPPFQFAYAITDAVLPTFQGFYFIFMVGPMLTIVTPMLYLEVIFVLFNGAALWLLFNRVKERELTPQEARELMRKLSGK
jgi:membrane-associated HD superfamily phosphohydrolase